MCCGCYNNCIKLHCCCFYIINSTNKPFLTFILTHTGWTSLIGINLRCKVLIWTDYFAESLLLWQFFIDLCRFIVTCTRLCTFICRISAVSSSHRSLRIVYSVSHTNWSLVLSLFLSLNYFFSSIHNCVYCTVVAPLSWRRKRRRNGRLGSVCLRMLPYDTKAAIKAFWLGLWDPSVDGVAFNRAKWVHLYRSYRSE